MAYPGNYSELSNDQKIIWLQKQRKGLVIGDYRNCLYCVYVHIKSSCDHCNTDTCVYENVFSGIKIPGVYDPFECCVELHNLGYLEIQFIDSIHRLSILREIDF